MQNQAKKKRGGEGRGGVVYSFYTKDCRPIAWTWHLAYKENNVAHSALPSESDQCLFRSIHVQFKK